MSMVRTADRSLEVILPSHLPCAEMFNALSGEANWGENNLHPFLPEGRERAGSSRCSVNITKNKMHPRLFWFPNK